MRAFGLLLLLCRGGATNASGGHEQWLYAKEGEPQQTTQSETWSDYWECSHDRTQSPIDIVTALALPDSELIGAIEPAIRRNHVRPTTYNHGFRLFHTSPNLKEKGSKQQLEEGATLKSVKGTTRLKGELYNFYQIHWHVPSENTIDGQLAAMEAHLVHQIAEPEYVGSNSHLAVIAVLYDLSSACNAQLDTFWPLFPTEVAAAAPNNTMVDVQARAAPARPLPARLPALGHSPTHDTLIHPRRRAGASQAMLEPLLPGGFFHWMGSLTTPPCTPGVSWYLLKQRAPVCQQQLDRLSRALTNVQRGVGVNNRIPQPLHQREVSMTPESECSGICGAPRLSARRGPLSAPAASPHCKGVEASAASAVAAACAACTAAAAAAGASEA